MHWFSSLITKEFVEYFENKDSVYFTVNCGGKTYNETYLKFNKTVECLFVMLNAESFEDCIFSFIEDKDSYEYKLAKAFYQDTEIPVFSKVFRSINGNVFDCDLESLSPEQLAIGLMFPFANRIGGSFEDKFAESGRLREFVLALYNKHKLINPIEVEL